MKLPGGASFWNFGAFPVIAAAVFQIAIILRAAESLAEFFVVQSLIAIGLSLACLQPRTWNSRLRLPSRLRWSLLFSLTLLIAVGFYFVFVPSQLGLVIVAFVAKKSCDVGREFVFLGDLSIPVVLIALVGTMEVVGIVLIFTGSLSVAIGLYLTSASVLIGYALWSVRGQSWSVGWVVTEIPHALSMTLFNMGSRLFLVAIASPVAHLTIGSILQVVNFLSPVTYAVYSKTRRVVLYVGAWLVCSTAIFVGSQTFIWVGGGLGAGVWSVAAFSGLLAFNSSAVVRISSGTSQGARTVLGGLVSSWAGLGALLGFSGIFRWETSFTLFLLGNAFILICFLATRSRLVGLRTCLAGSG